jgi:hypothetical protein
MPRATVSAGAESTFSPAIEIIGNFNLSIRGTFAGTVTVQRSSDGTTWRDVDSFTAPTEEVGFDPMSMLYRVGIKPGDYTSGTAVAEIAGLSNFPGVSS